MGGQTLEELLLNVNEETKTADEQEKQSGIFSTEEIEKIADALGEDKKEEGKETAQQTGGEEMTKEARTQNKVSLVKALQEKYTPESLVKLANDYLAEKQGKTQQVPPAEPQTTETKETKTAEVTQEITKTANFEFEDQLMEKIAWASIEGRAQAISELQYITDNMEELEKEAAMPAFLKSIATWIRGTGGLPKQIATQMGTFKGKWPTRLMKSMGHMYKPSTGWLPQMAALTGAGALGVAGAAKGIKGLKRTGQTKGAEVEEPKKPLTEEEKIAEAVESEWLGKCAAWGYLAQVAEIAKLANVELPKLAQPADEASQAAVQGVDAATGGLEGAGIDPAAAAEVLIEAVKENPEEAAAELVEAKSPEQAAQVIAEAVLEEQASGAPPAAPPVAPPA